MEFEAQNFTDLVKTLTTKNWIGEVKQHLIPRIPAANADKLQTGANSSKLQQTPANSSKLLQSPQQTAHNLQTIANVAAVMDVCPS